MPRIYQAKYLATMAAGAGVIENAGLAVESGRVLDAGPLKMMRDDVGGDVVDLGEVLVTPGLVNAHTHLEMSLHRPGEPPASFGEWLGRIAGSAGEWKPAEAAAVGAEESLRFGVTHVGDITQFPDQTRPATATSKLAGVSFAEVLGIGPAQSRADAKLDSAVVAPTGEGRWTYGITPHAPYTVSLETTRRAVRAAAGRPLAMHIAESTEEAQFVRTVTGPLASVWERFDGWDPSIVKRFDGSPIAWAEAAGLLDTGAVLAHVNYLQPGDLDRLRDGRSTVAYCPRTHAWFGHPPHPFREMMAAGVSVCLATDGRGTAPDLNLLAEAAKVLADHPDLDPMTLWTMITVMPATALELRAGSLLPGRAATFNVWPVSGSRPLETVIRRAERPSSVYVEGRRI